MKRKVLSFIDCIHSDMVGDGYCNDETNNQQCNYDQGDCCGSCVNTNHCIECDCIGNFTNNQATNPSIGNGFCEDDTNTVACSYDGGDCCFDVNFKLCTECICYCQNVELVGNGFCNDVTNNALCNYDGDDCCVNVNDLYCSECMCYIGGIITSPGFPQDYSPFLDLEWLIEVPLGQNIFIDFISFDVESGYQCWYILPQKQLLSIPKYE